MTVNVKKIVAREGLIIITCSVCAGLFLYLGSLIPYSNPTSYSYDVSTGGHKFVVETEGGPTPYSGVYSFEDKANLYKVLRGKYPKELGKYDGLDLVPDDLQIGPHKAHYTFKGNVRNVFKNLGLLSIFVAYPLYLLTRFILWAVKTLKEK